MSNVATSGQDDVLGLHDQDGTTTPLPSEQRPVTQRLDNVTYVLAEPRPKFSGAANTTWSSFSRKFRRFCNSRGIIGDTAMIEEFEFCLANDSVAARWFDSLSQPDKNTWARLDAAGHQRWPTLFDVQDARDSYADLLALNLSENDLTKTVHGTDGLSPVQRFARDAFNLAARIPASDVGQDRIIKSFFPKLPTPLILALGSQASQFKTMRDLCKEIAKLTPDDLAPFVQSRAQRPPNIVRQPANSDNRLSQPVQPVAGRYNTQTIARPTGPPVPPRTFSTDQEGIRAYQRALEQVRYVTPSLSVAWPLRPGTQPPGSGECHRCGMRDHFASNCQAQNPLPTAEQQYRRLAIRSGAPRQLRAALHVGHSSSGASSSPSGSSNSSQSSQNSSPDTSADLIDINPRFAYYNGDSFVNNLIDTDPHIGSGNASGCLQWGQGAPNQK
uniref:CCHC-type domain-containing protein n=1 Tax=Melanopsichium pennsylvanicum 4 TaxID=1398559 RepID=A0A077RCR8_9BASI|nr:hypothetical protein BN887_02593 [Melanopsichium pennsylvanicum 4]